MSKLQNPLSYSYNSKKTETHVKKGLEPIGVLLEIDQIEPSKRQPRRYFNPRKIEELTESIREYGIVEPLIVRSLSNGKYELVAGERRYRAALKAGFSKVPVIVKDLDEDQAFELALLENMQRDDLNSIDETEGMLDLLCQSLKLSREDVISLLNKAANARKRGQSLTDNVARKIEIIDKLFLTVGRLSRESFRTNRLPLLNLNHDVLNVLRQGKLEYTKARAIDKLSTKNQRQELVKSAIEEKLSLSQIKEKIRGILDDKGSAERLSRHVEPGVSYKTQPEMDESSSDVLPASFDDSRFSHLGDLYVEFKVLMGIRSDVWNDDNKRTQIRSLLNQLKEVLIDF